MQDQTSDNETRNQGLGRAFARYARQSVVMLVAMTLLVGVIYPLLILGVGRAAFPNKAQGSLIVQDGQVVGSSLIGQSFSDPRYFWSRPSATVDGPYNAAASGGSNLGPTNPARLRLLQERIAALRAADPSNALPIPIDLVSASASGLDPHISPAAAQYQVARVAGARGLSADAVQALVQKYTEGRQFGFLGEPRVNVLLLNLALDRLNP